MTDPKVIENIARGDEFISGNSDPAHFSAALSLTQYYDFLAYLMNSGKIDEEFVSTQLKCQLVSWDAAVLIFGNKLPPAARDIASRITKYGKNAVQYYQLNKDHLPC